MHVKGIKCLNCINVYCVPRICEIREKLAPKLKGCFVGWQFAEFQAVMG